MNWIFCLNSSVQIECWILRHFFFILSAILFISWGMSELWFSRIDKSSNVFLKRSDVFQINLLTYPIFSISEVQGSGILLNLFCVSSNKLSISLLTSGKLSTIFIHYSSTNLSMSFYVPLYSSLIYFISSSLSINSVSSFICSVILTPSSISY